MHRLRAAETGDIEAMTDLLLSHGPNPWNHLPEEGVRAHLRAIADGEVRAVLAERDDRLLGFASFRRTEQILALVGCDRLTIAPPLLKELQASDTPVVRKLIPASQILPRPVPLSEAEFRWEHNQDPMAVEKLAEGIRLFAVDQRKLEDLLAAKLSL